MRYLPRLLKRSVRKGRLVVTGPEGERHEFGDGDGPDVAIRIADPSFDWKIFLNPELRAAEAYMDGALVMEKGEVYDLLKHDWHALRWRAGGRRSPRSPRAPAGRTIGARP